MMNITNITQLVFCVMFFITCKVINKTPTEVNLPKKEYTFPCELCDFWINIEEAHLPKERYITSANPFYSEVVKPNDQILECNPVNCNMELVVGWKEGSDKIYTFQEWNRANSIRFCFIGKTRDEIKDIFVEADSYDIVSTINGLHFHSLIESSDATNLTSPSFIAHSWNAERYLQFINFSSDSIFLGNHRDSIFLNQCINRDKNR